MTGKPDKIQVTETLTQSLHSPRRCAHTGKHQQHFTHTLPWQRFGGGFKRDGFTFRFYHIAIIRQTERGKSR